MENTLAKARPEVTITLKGQQYVLKFDWWAIALIEEERGPAFLSAKNLSNLTASKALVLAWACLAGRHPEFDGTTADERRAGLRKVAELAESPDDMATIAAAVATAIANGSLNEKKGEKDNSPKKNEESPSE